MKVCILGGTGRIGRHATTVSLAAGNEVVVLARSAATLPAGVIPVIGDARDPGVLARAIEGTAAVIAALGPAGNRADEADALEAAMRALVGLMEREGVRRLVALSGAGVSIPGDTKPVIDRVASRVVGIMARHVLAAKQREYAVFAGSGLDWTALRPPIVTDGEPRGYRLTKHLEPMGRVTRADVGRALADQVLDTAFLGAAPFVLSALRGAPAAS